MTVMVFDVETTGLKAAHLLQIGALLATDDGDIINAIDSYVYPGEDITIEPGAEKVHGISLRTAARCGIPHAAAVRIIRIFASKSRTIATYGTFDIEVVERFEPVLRPGARHINVMDVCTTVCQLPGKFGGYKFPKLGEAVKIILERDHTEAHDAYGDAVAALDLYVALRRRGLIDDAPR